MEQGRWGVPLPICPPLPSHQPCQAHFLTLPMPTPWLDLVSPQPPSIAATRAGFPLCQPAWVPHCSETFHSSLPELLPPPL